MAGRTLVASRATKLFPYYEEQLKSIRFRDVVTTSAEKDGLNMAINDVNPNLLLIGCDFYDCATPFMMARLHRQFPDLNIAAISTGKFPAHLGAGMIVNGVKSFLSLWDGIEQFHKGLEYIRVGKGFISETVQRQRENQSDQTRPSRELTDKQIEVTRFLCNGFKTEEIADKMHISVRTVKFHKSELYNNFKIRNENELIRVALYLKIIPEDELVFYGGNFEFSELQGNNTLKRRTA